MKCSKCGSKVFWIDIKNSCHDCEHNAAWDEEIEDYTYDQEIIDAKGLIRDYVEEEGECWFGSSNGEGCHMYTCVSCKTQTNLSRVDY